MSDDTIKRALEVAAIAHCKARLGKGYNPCSAACDWCRDNSAAAIAAFLEALPALTDAGGPALYHSEGLAAAVRRAAGGE